MSDTKTYENYIAEAKHEHKRILDVLNSTVEVATRPTKTSQNIGSVQLIGFAAQLPFLIEMSYKAMEAADDSQKNSKEVIESAYTALGAIREHISRAELMYLNLLMA